VQDLFLFAVLVGVIVLVAGVLLELAKFLRDAAATFFSYLRRVLHVERREDMQRRAS
jgi:hypothetical protein